MVAGDFAGRYRLFANGQWSGTLDLKVEGRGVVVGQFRSDLHGTSYPVSGQVATDVAQKVFFAIKYPRARQEFEGFLWAEGKGAMAGVASLNERPVGFFAIREGGRYAPQGAEIGPIAPADDDRPGATRGRGGRGKNHRRRQARDPRRIGRGAQIARRRRSRPGALGPAQGSQG